MECRSGDADALRNGQKEKFEKSSDAVLAGRNYFKIEVEEDREAPMMRARSGWHISQEKVEGPFEPSLWKWIHRKTRAV